MLEPRAHGSVAPWSRFFCFWDVVPNPKIVWSLTLLLSPRIMDLKMLCFPLLPNFSEGELLEPLFLSLQLSPPSLVLHPSCEYFPSPSMMGSFEEWLCGCSCVPGDANSLFSLTLLVLGLRLMYLWLMRHLFCTTKQLKNTLLIPMSCVTKLIMRWPSLGPSREDQVSKPHLTIVFLKSWPKETKTQRYMQGDVWDPSQTFRTTDLTAACSLPWNQNPVSLSSLSLHFPIIPSHIRQHAKGEGLSSDRSRFKLVWPWPRHLRSLSFYPGEKGETISTPQALLLGILEIMQAVRRAEPGMRQNAVSSSSLLLPFLLLFGPGWELPRQGDFFSFSVLRQEARRHQSVQIAKAGLGKSWKTSVTSYLRSCGTKGISRKCLPPEGLLSVHRKEAPFYPLECPLSQRSVSSMLLAHLSSGGR